MSLNRKLLFVILLFCVTASWGKTLKREANIGYLYPSGAQKGTTVVVTAGGQYLRGPSDVYVTGKGVHCSAIKYIRPKTNLNRDERAAVKKMLKEVRGQRFAELNTKNQVIDDYMMPKEDSMNKDLKDPDVKIDEVEVPDHPLFYDIENKSLRELEHLEKIIFLPRTKKQQNRQLSECVMLEITVDANAKPGMRQIRVQTRYGLSNPVNFHVGQFPEMLELEPNDRKNYFRAANAPKQAKSKPVELPVTINGQILPGDIDKFRFYAKKGQQLVIETQARSLRPYLADAVPGWFQATIALYDFKGKEIAFADDYRFDPDPVLFYQIPKDGEYDLKIHDAIYRGREDFVYRVSIGEQPFITQIFPLGAKEDTKATASIKGWNLADDKLKLNTRKRQNIIKYTTLNKGALASNRVPYTIDSLEECMEAKANDSIKEAQLISMPMIINGRISESGDVDVFKFQGKAGEKIVAEVNARKLNSPLDSIVRLTDESGKVLGVNDDYVDKDKFLHKDLTGLITHNADSYLLAELAEDGTYYLHITDVQNHGSDAHGYRLRIGLQEGDFALRATPSTLTMNSGAVTPISVHVLRKDGFDGEIDVRLIEPEGFSIQGGRIPAGCDKITMTVKSTYSKTEDQVVNLKLQGRAKINGKIVTRAVVAADDTMQAFLYRHLVPTKELVFWAKKSRWKATPFNIINKRPIEIPAGGKVKVRVKTWSWMLDRKFYFDLVDAPAGITLEDVAVENKAVVFWLKADKEIIKDAISGNLIIEASTKSKPKEGQSPDKVKIQPVGTMPAISFDVTQ